MVIVYLMLHSSKACKISSLLVIQPKPNRSLLHAVFFLCRIYELSPRHSIKATQLLRAEMLKRWYRQGRRQKKFQSGGRVTEKKRKIALLSLFQGVPTEKKTENN